LASAHPADPPPTITKSYRVDVIVVLLRIVGKGYRCEA
jgi:hypothetical protein